MSLSYGLSQQVTVGRIPDVFIVGAPRCGTTALHAYLQQHPQIYMSPVKELQFFCTDLFLPLPQIELSDQTAYLSMFSAATDQRRIGEACPYYLYSQRAPAAIKSFSPDARVIIMLRNPPDMMYSMYCLRRHAAIFHDDQELVATFEQALAAERERISGPLYLRYRELGRYATRVEKYLEVFGREAVHTIVFDDLIADPLAVYRMVCRFLDVDTSFVPDFELAPEQRAASARPRSRLLARLLWKPGTMATRVAWSMPIRARRTIRDLLNGWNMARPPRLDPLLRRRLSRQCATDIGRLEKLLGRDLSAWSHDSG